MAFVPLLFFPSPILLITIGVLLYNRKPRPALIFLFLISLGISILHFIGFIPHVSTLYLFARYASPILVVLSFAAITEVAVRKLKSHYLTCGLTLPVALAYWFVTSAVAAAI